MSRSFRYHRGLAVLLASSVLATLPQAAIAQITEGQETTDDNGIADIVVTAQRRAQNVQDVPIAITAVSGAQLRESG